MRSGGARLAALVAVVALPVLLPSALAASTPSLKMPVIQPGTSVPSAMSIVQGAIARSTSALSSLSSQIAASTSVTPADRSALNQLIANDTNSLQALSSKVSLETTVPALRGDVGILGGYHIGTYVVPVASTILNIDATLAAGVKLSAQESPLQTAITAANQAGKNETAESTLLANAQHKVTQATGLIASSANTLLADTPLADPSYVLVIKTAQNLESRASTDIANANNELQSIVNLLARPAAKAR